MVVLEHADVVVADRHRVIHIDQEWRGDTWVLVVVKGCRDIAGHFLKVVKLKFLFHAARVNEVVKGLADIGGVRLVVVCDGLVALGQNPNEVYQSCEF